MVCWVGNTDLVGAGVRESSNSKSSSGLGPIAGGVDAELPDRVIMLCNYPETQGRKYQKWLTGRTTAKVELRMVSMKDPTDYRSIYKHADALLRELTAERAQTPGNSSQIIIHLSPGTPAMQQVWVLLGMTRYPARLIKSSLEQGVAPADIPFDLAFEYVDANALKSSDAALEQASVAAPHPGAKFGDIVYRGPAMQEVVSRARAVSKRSVPVLILGESGTGKELFARAIHADRRAIKGGQFVAINCGAIPKDLVESTLFGYSKGAFTGATKDTKGAFEEADGGTLFLDELGEMPLDVQVKLLRAVQEKKITRVGEQKERPVDVRLIAATHKDLYLAVQKGEFREDLFYRLAVAVLELPPLRKREGDMNALIDALLEKVNKEGEKDEVGYTRKTLAPKARSLLQNHDWPGNVRELENTLLRAAVWSAGSTLAEKEIDAALLRRPSSSPASSALLERPFSKDFSILKLHDEISSHYVKRALGVTHGNKTHAARLLGLGSHQVLSKWMKRLGMRE
jgi:transcriptional regulator with GAF, ATPase, and Fis domain